MAKNNTYPSNIIIDGNGTGVYDEKNILLQKHLY